MIKSEIIHSKIIFSDILQKNQFCHIDLGVPICCETQLEALDTEAVQADTSSLTKALLAEEKEFQKSSPETTTEKPATSETEAEESSTATSSITAEASTVTAVEPDDNITAAAIAVVQIVDSENAKLEADNVSEL